MSRFPVIDTPCPFRAAEMPQPGRDHCGHCDRQVHNLDGMSSQQREAFMRSCQGKVCVAYTVHRAAPRRNFALGVGLLASLAGSGLAAAQETAKLPASEGGDQDNTINAIDIASVESTTILTAEQIAAIPVASNLTMLMGGVLNASDARWAHASELASSGLPALEEIDELQWLPSQGKP